MTRTLGGEDIVLATGSVKRPIPGTQFGGRVIGTEEAWALAELPATLAVVGAGASGAEIASAYARLGVEVLLFEALDRVLPTEDADISKLAERGLSKQGMTIHTGTLVRRRRVGRRAASGSASASESRRVRLAGDRRRPRTRRRGARTARPPVSRCSTAA